MSLRSRWLQGAWASALAAGVVTLASTAAVAQDPPPGAEPDESLIEQARPLYRLVDEAMTRASTGVSRWDVDPTGEEPPSDVPGAGEATLSSTTIRAPQDQVYIPFEIALDPKTVAASNAVVYVRAAPQGAAAPAAGEDEAGEEGSGQATYPFEDFYRATVQALGPGEPLALNGYAQLPAGTYDLFVAVREPADDPEAAFQATVVKESLEVPNYFGGDLTASSVLLVKEIRELPSDPTPEQQHENPYTFGRNQLVVARDGVFGEQDDFNLLMFVYNFGQDDQQHPDVTVEYQLFTANDNGEGESEVARIEPQTYDGSTVGAAEELPVSLQFQVSALEAGSYRLVVTVTDNTSGKSLTRDAPFTVASS